jgi:hypothetical protein
MDQDASLLLEQILVTYFKFNPLGLESGKLVKPILLPFRTYKE